jgi:hypothetical protein
MGSAAQVGGALRQRLRVLWQLSGGRGPPSVQTTLSGQAPPAGPQWVSRLAPLEPQALAYDRPLCASLEGFTLHAATRSGALDPAGREALLRYVLRAPVAQERVEQRADGRSLPKVPPPRATNRVGRVTPGAIARGRNFWRARSPWTSSPAPGARGG